MVELAFLHAYLAWEVFLEETFVLYLMGMTAPRGSTPRRYTFPPSRRHAMDWIAEGRDYAKWDAGNVKSRAQRYFEHGKPFTPVLQSHQNALDEAKTIRNAVAHESDSAQEKFKTLARQKLGGVLPPGITPAKFLNLSVPGSNPPLLFLQFYTQKFEYVAGEIVPT